MNFWRQLKESNKNHYEFLFAEKIISIKIATFQTELTSNVTGIGPV